MPTSCNASSPTQASQHASASPPPAIMNEPTAEAAEGFAAVNFPIIGIGASAGGLAAFEAFFSGLPADTDPGMAVSCSQLRLSLIHI